MKHFIFLLIFLGFTCMSVFCGSKVSIVSPQQLSTQFDKTNGIAFAIANYGKIPYGAHFVGGLALADPIDACEYMDHFTAGEMQFDHNVIAVVRKGNCAPTIKTRNSQNAGAKMVIIVQDTDDAAPQPIGVGLETEGLTIPTIVIPKTEGEKLIKFIEKLPFPPLNPDDLLPIVSINFPYDDISDTVALDFFYSSEDVKVANEFLAQIAPKIKDPEGPFKLTPHFITWECQLCKQLNYNVPLTGDCISGGRYCAPDPDDEGPTDGRDILFEDLRQACLWKSSEPVWWAYMSMYPNRCLSEKCANDRLNSLYGGDKTEIGKIKDCIDKSFFKANKNDKSAGNPSMDDNSILFEQRQTQLEYDITVFPVLLINHRPYDGNLTEVDAIFREICQSVKNPPLQCRDVGIGYATSKFGVLISLVSILSIAAFVVFFCYRKLATRDSGIELQTHANQMVTQYMALKDVKPMVKDDEENDT